MSTGEPMAFEHAYKAANEIHTRLSPACARLKAAGSLRRRRPFIRDLEMVCEPLTVTDLLGAESLDVQSIRQACAMIGDIEKGGEKYIKVCNVLGIEGLALDLFIVTPPAQWGSILAIRTGPAELGKFAVSRMPDFGLYHRDGRIVDRVGKLHPTPTEEDFFAAARLPCLPPAQRDSRAAMTPLPASDSVINLLREACKP